MKEKKVGSFSFSSFAEFLLAAAAAPAGSSKSFWRG
jgi:hypothetical protein